MPCHWLFIQLGLWKLGQFVSSHYYRYTRNVKVILKAYFVQLFIIMLVSPVAVSRSSPDTEGHLV